MTRIQSVMIRLFVYIHINELKINEQENPISILPASNDSCQVDSYMSILTTFNDWLSFDVSNFHELQVGSYLT